MRVANERCYVMAIMIRLYCALQTLRVITNEIPVVV